MCLNAGAALYVARSADTLRDGVAMARETIENGGAAETLRSFLRFTQEWAG